jgi:hypothetical protein
MQLLQTIHIPLDLLTESIRGYNGAAGKGYATPDYSKIERRKTDREIEGPVWRKQVDTTFQVV